MKVALPVTGTFDATGTVSLDPVKLDLRARLAGAALGPYQAYVPVARADPGAARRRRGHHGGAGAADRPGGEGHRRRARPGHRRAGPAGRHRGADGDDGPRLPVADDVAVDRFRMERSWAMVERRADGALPLATLFRPFPGRPGPGGARWRGAGSAGVRRRGARERARGRRADIVDGAVSPAARVEITGARLEARDFTWPARRPVALQLQVSTPGGGSVRVEGQLGVGSRSLDGKLVASGVDVAPIRPYLPVRARIAGKAGADAHREGRPRADRGHRAGQGGPAGPVLRGRRAPLVTAARIETTGIDYAWPATAKIDRVEIQKPTAVLERRADGTLPLGALLVPPGAAPRETAGQPVAPRPRPARPSTWRCARWW